MLRCRIFGCKIVEVLSSHGWADCRCCVAVIARQFVCVRCWRVNNVNYWNACRRIFRGKRGGVYR